MHKNCISLELDQTNLSERLIAWVDLLEAWMLASAWDIKKDWKDSPTQNWFIRVLCSPAGSFKHPPEIPVYQLFLSQFWIYIVVTLHLSQMGQVGSDPLGLHDGLQPTWEIWRGNGNQLGDEAMIRLSSLSCSHIFRSRYLWPPPHCLSCRSCHCTADHWRWSIDPSDLTSKSQSKLWHWSIFSTLTLDYVVRSDIEQRVYVTIHHYPKNKQYQEVHRSGNDGASIPDPSSEVMTHALHASHCPSTCGHGPRCWWLERWCCNKEGVQREREKST